VPACPRVAQLWQWSDSGPPDAVVAGLVTRGLFAQSLYELEFARSAMKLALAYPAVQLMKETAVELQVVSGKMKERDLSTQLSALSRAHELYKLLKPLLEHSKFPTKVKDGSSLSAAAVCSRLGPQDWQTRQGRGVGLQHGRGYQSRWRHRSSARRRTAGAA
jgi:hypothetical protein